MKISTKGRYALHMMLDIALNGDAGPVSFSDVSSRQGISIKYMEQIGSKLVRAGLLRSVRGAQGGYYLTRPASGYTVGEILRTTEGQLYPVPCLEETTCPRSLECLTIPLWERLNDAINDVVDNMTLQDLIDINRSRHMIHIDGDATVE